MARSPRPEATTALYPDGSPIFTGFMIDGVPTGEWRWYDPAGHLSRAGRYRDGEPTGVFRDYDHAGAVTRETDMDAMVALWLHLEAELRAILPLVAIPDECAASVLEFVGHNEFGLAWETLDECLGPETPTEVRTRMLALSTMMGRSA